MLRLILSAALAIIAGPAIADFSACTSITADADRLACFDRAAGEAATAEGDQTTAAETAATEPTATDPAPTDPAAPTAGAWDVEIKKSDFEDTTDVYLRLTSNEVVQCGRFGGPEHASLLVRCKENTTAVFFATACHLASGHGGYGNVDVRLDADKAFTSSMDASTDNSALGLWSGAKSIPFAKKMLGKDRMIIRFTPFSESSTTAEFTISGFDEAVKPLREACNW